MRAVASACSLKNADELFDSIVVEVDEWDEPTQPYHRNVENTGAFLNMCESNLNKLEALRKSGKAGSGEYGEILQRVQRLTRARASVLGITLKPGK